MAENLDHHDRRSRRCPKLRHPILFSYCRSPGSDDPCRAIFNCWWEHFDVVSFVRAHYGDAGVNRVLAPRPDKLLSLIDLIEQARKNTGSEGYDGGRAAETSDQAQGAL